MMQIHIPEHIEVINQKLGGNCFLVGGCVRDSILGRKLNDYDITSSNLPEDIMAMSCDEFQVNPVGIDFGVVQIVMPGYAPVEHATFRSDGEYSDFRRPDSVNYSSDINSDLLRRDFTMNAIAHNISTKEFVDPLFGTIDIASGIIRFVGHSDARIQEDPLRMMRAVRFVSQLGFDLDEFAAAAITENRHLLSKISKERITVEWFKLCSGKHAALALKLTEELLLLDVIFPEMVPCRNCGQNKYHRLNVYDHCVDTFMSLTKILKSDRIKKVTDAFEMELNVPVLLTAALLHDCGKPSTKTTGPDGGVHFYDHNHVGKEMLLISKSLCLSSEEKSTLMNVVDMHMTLHMLSGSYATDMVKRRSITRFLKKVGKYVPYVYALTVADLMASRAATDAETNFNIVEPFIDEILKVYTGFYKVYKQNPLISGSDLIRLGLTPGREFSVILDAVSDRFVNGELTTFEEAISWVKLNYA